MQDELLRGKGLSKDGVSAGVGFHPIPRGALEHELHHRVDPPSRQKNSSQSWAAGCPGWWRRVHNLPCKLALGKGSAVRNPQQAWGWGSGTVEGSGRGTSSIHSTLFG